MYNIVETLSIAASSVALFTLVFVIILNLYMMKRNGFYVNANCWFCNTWTKVLYANRNSFDCPSCLQYNGFDKDGGYNKVIESQHNMSFNKHKTTDKTEHYTNGLCTYCNNNQQLKVYQLAKFTPINEETYDKEVEHFQKQLENAYKLCKKCEKVLKTTIENKNAWIFGNHLKNLRRKGLSMLDLTKSSHGITKDVKQSFCLKLIKYTLVAFTVLVLCQVLHVKIDYPSKDVKKYIPKSFIRYELILKDFYSMVFNVSKSVGEEIDNLNAYLPKNVRIKTGNLLPITSVGFLLDFVLLICDKTSVFWKINGVLGWIVLFLSSSVTINQDYFLFVNVLQVFSSSALLYGYVTYDPAKKTKNAPRAKFQFKKITKLVEASESSEDDTDEILNTSESSTNSRKSRTTSKPSHCQSYHSSSPIPHFGNSIRHTADLNHSFTTAKSVPTTSILNNSMNTVNSSSLHSDLNQSLDNLHLSNLNFRPQPCTSPVFSVSSMNRPILSPPKLKNITQNPWTAGGFWKNDANILPMAVDNTNLSRSSSQSSGFVSSNEPVNYHFHSSPPSRDPSVGGDMERASILSESAYHFMPINSNVGQFPSSQQLYYKADNNTFYPVLNQHNMLHIQNGVPNHNFQTFQNSFGNSSIRSVNTRAGLIQSPPLFAEKTQSSLFKNVNRPMSEPDSIRKPLF